MMRLFAPQPAPKSKLGHYRRLSTTAGVHVSPIALGGMNIGDKWEEFGFGSMTKEDSFKLLDAYFDLGGNFLDTANFYQAETSELFIGEWAEQRGIRDQLFVTTKYTNNTKLCDPSTRQKVLYGGNNIKSMHLAVESSLKKLRTTYIDLLYVHWWDFTTSVQEMMHALHALVMARKVMYLGVSDAPAWVVAKANQYARDHALTPFCIYQGQWSVLDRSFERDIIPMARDEGMALSPWGVLAGGKIRTDAEEEKRRQTGEKGRTVLSEDWERTESEKQICRVLEKVAAEVGAKSINSSESFLWSPWLCVPSSFTVAIAYVMHKTRYVFPVIGGRKVEHLVANLEALDISLTREHISALDSVVPFDPGFPHNFFGDGTYYNPMHNSNGHLDFWPIAQPITPIRH